MGAAPYRHFGLNARALDFRFYEGTRLIALILPRVLVVGMKKSSRRGARPILGNPRHSWEDVGEKSSKRATRLIRVPGRDFGRRDAQKSSCV